MRIELPTHVSAHTIHNFLSKSSFFPPEADELTLVFNKTYNRIEPFGLAMLAAWAEWCATKGTTIACTNPAAPGAEYLARMGLFRYVPGPADLKITEHEEAGRFIPIRKIATQDDLNRFVIDLAPMLHQPDNIQPVRYCFNELTRNVLEHAGAPAYVCAQYYPRQSRVAVGVADCGVGIKRSLERTHNPFDHDASAIVSALKPGVTGTTLSTYGSADNAGLGLFYTRAIARASGNYFAVVSGNAAYRLNQAQSKLPLTRDPEADRHKLFRELPRWQGTAVAVDISTLDTSFDELVAEIGEVASKSRTEAVRIAPKLKFT